MTVLATFTTVAVAREDKVGENLGAKFARVLCIRYPISIKKNSVSALLDSGSEVYAIHPAFAKELGLPIRPTNVGRKKSMAPC